MMRTATTIAVRLLMMGGLGAGHRLTFLRADVVLETKRSEA